MTSGFVHISGIPLRGSGWLSTGYTLAQTDLEKWLVQLCRALQPLHENNQLYGAMSPDHVVLDPQGMLHLDAGLAASIESRAVSKGLHDTVSPGFAAFEQYVDDPAWPLGPWTDIYGVSALARSLILKSPPPDALQRMVSDTCEPLRDMNLPAYTPQFLGVIDRGMSLLGQQRFANIDAFSAALNLPLDPVICEQGCSEVAAAPVPEHLLPAAMPASAGGSEPESAKKKPLIWMMAFVVIALIAAGAYLLRGQGADIQATAIPQVSQVATVTAPVQEPESLQVVEPTVEVVPDGPPAVSLELTPVIQLDMQAQMAARSLLAAANQAVIEQKFAEAAAVQEQAVPAYVEPTQVVPASEARLPAETVGANIRVGLSIRPWGEVLVNGASQGVSPPLRSLSLKPGEYRIRIVNGDLPPHEQTLTVRAGESARITHDFGVDK